MFEEMMHNNIQDKQMRLAKGKGVEELQAYYSLLAKYKGKKKSTNNNTGQHKREQTLGQKPVSYKLEENGSWK